ncbi:MAG: L-alanine-DL-glutamate epimerase-like enolase superfamily enzyme [Gammaproteobacteria bacterium]
MDGMKIKELHIYQHDLPVKNGPYTMSGQDVYQLDTTIVRLVSDTGITGWGEVCPVGPLYAPVTAKTIRAALVDMAPKLIGVEATPRAAEQTINSAVFGHNYAASAIDIAVYDMVGKSLGVSVATLLGGALRTRMPSYFATGIGAPDDIARLAKEKVAEGYPRIQIKAGAGNVATDIETVRKVWQAVGPDTRIAVDCNRGLNQRDALRLSRECQNIPFALEQPCNTIEEVAAIRPRIHHAMLLDESITDLNTALKVIGDGLVDGFGMKISRLGGLSKFAAFRDICAARRLPHTVDDSWGGNIVAAACAHMGATVGDKTLEGVWLATPYQAKHYGPDAPILVENGYVNLPAGPGLGIAPDPDQFGTPIASF